MQWSGETYRLDEIVDKFTLPCVIRVNEGYYSEDDAGEFSLGDILKIDQHVILHKVAANFVSKRHPSVQTVISDTGYVSLVEKEILVPLKYTGKLNILDETRTYHTIRSLAKDFPRYAMMLANMRFTNDKGGTLEIQAGTVIELDRVVPADGVRHKEDRLVVRYESPRGQVYGAVPISASCQLRTEPDHNLYTLQEVVDRCQLPREVRFVGDEMKRVYTTDLLEGLENMKHFNADTLRLNRIVLQKVLVCHYKAIDELPGGGGGGDRRSDFCRRTIVLLPLDMTEIREIEVNVLQNEDDMNYEQMFFTNESRSADMNVIDGSLYAEFARRPRLIKLSPGDPLSLPPTDEAPPVPPRIGRPEPTDSKPPKLQPKPKNVSPHYDGYMVPRKQVPPAVPPGKTKNIPRKQSQEKMSEDEDDQYEYPELPVTALATGKSGVTGPSFPPKISAGSVFSEPTPVVTVESDDDTEGDYEIPEQDMPYGTTATRGSPWTPPGTLKLPEATEKNKRSGKISGLAHKLQSKLGKHRRPDPTGSVSARDPHPPTTPTSPVTPSDQNRPPHSPLFETNDEDLYTEIIDEEPPLVDVKGYIVMSNPQVPNNSSNNVVPDRKGGNQSFDYEANKPKTCDTGHQSRISNRPVAEVRPLNADQVNSESTVIQDTVKPFDKLGMAELAERLRLCSMVKLADVCRSENVDGKFIVSMSEKDLQLQPFSLSPFEIIKLRQVKTNWIPQ